MTPVDLFAAQPYMTLKDYSNAASFYHKLDLLMAAVDKKTRPAVPALVVFPEDLATFLVLADNMDAIRGAATMDEAFTRIGRSLAVPLLGTMARYRTASLRRAFFLLAAPKVWRIWHSAMARLAQQHHVYIVAGSALLPEDLFEFQTAALRPRSNRVYNTSFAVNPAGQVVHVTRKVNLVPTQEDVLDLSPGSLDASLGSFDIAGIRCATAICYDGFRVPHTPDEPHFVPLLPLLDAQGVQIVAQPSANPWHWNEPFPFQPGILRREQWLQEGAFSLLDTCRHISAVVNPQLLLAALDIHFDGPSTIYGRSGNQAVILAQSACHAAVPESEDVVHVSWS